MLPSAAELMSCVDTELRRRDISAEVTVSEGRRGCVVLRIDHPRALAQLCAWPSGSVDLEVLDAASGEARLLEAHEQGAPLSACVARLVAALTEDD